MEVNGKGEEKLEGESEVFLESYRVREVLLAEGDLKGCCLKGENAEFRLFSLPVEDGGTNKEVSGLTSFRLIVEFQ
jgi:hypothetical protein